MAIPASFLQCASVAGGNTFTGAQTFSDAVACSSTLAVTGAATLASTCAITGAVTCASTLAVTGALTVTAAITANGGISRGVRQILPFGMVNIAAGDNATPASSTPVQIYWSGVSTLTTCGFVAMRAGSLVGLSANLNAAAAGSNLIVGVYKNGTIINASAIVTLASATNDVKANGTFTQNAYTFAAGDVIDVRIRTGSGWSATTADLSVAVEIES